MTARIGIVSDSSLHRYETQSLLLESGYAVAASCAPEQLDRTFLASIAADAWVVSLSAHYDGVDRVSLLMDELDAPILMDEFGGECLRNGELHLRKQRVLHKLKGLRFRSRVGDISAESTPNPLLIKAQAQYRDRQVAPNIWVLGASLGGPEALTDFLAEIPANLPVSFVYAQHIDANCCRVLVEVMSRNSHLKVRLLDEGSVLIPGQLGIVPVDQSLEFLPLGRIRHSEKSWDGPYAPAIDRVMVGIAETYRDRAGAIIFSGMGDDGAASCQLMRRQGGSVWVQAPASCICEAMPLAAIQSGRIDYMASPAGLAQALKKRYLNACISQEMV